MPQLNQLGQVKLTQTIGTLVSHPQHRVSQKQSSSLQVEQTFHKVVASVYKCPVESAGSHQAERVSISGFVGKKNGEKKSIFGKILHHISFLCQIPFYGVDAH